MCLKLDTEPLQGLENVLETDLAQMQKPQPVNPELPSWPVSAFLHMQNNFSVNNVLSRTATVHHAILDDASVMSEDDHPTRPDSPGGAGMGGACAISCLGSSGLHLREALLGAGRGPVLQLGSGGCKSIFTSDASISTGAEEAFFLCSTKVNSQYVLSTTSPPLVQFVKRLPGRIGVFLDYDNGAVSFSDVSGSSLIYSSLPSAFSSPLIPFLCLKSP